VHLLVMGHVCAPGDDPRPCRLQLPPWLDLGWCRVERVQTLKKVAELCTGRFGTVLGDLVPQCDGQTVDTQRLWRVLPEPDRGQVVVGEPARRGDDSVGQRGDGG